MPRIRSSLGLATSDLEWIATSYLLVFASLIICGGRVADRYGRRRTLVVGLCVFGVASVAAGLAPRGELLVAPGRYRGWVQR